MASLAVSAQEQDLSGAWLLNLSSAQGQTSAVLQLERTNGSYVGQSAPLDVLQACPLSYKGESARGRLRLVVQCRGAEIGALELTRKNAGLFCNGNLL